MSVLSHSNGMLLVLSAHVCVCVCQNEKRVPDEWQARQAKITSAMKRKVQNRKRPISSVESLSS